jgi:hypothetical protein
MVKDRGFKLDEGVSQAGHNEYGRLRQVMDDCDKLTYFNQLLLWHHTANFASA